MIKIMMMVVVAIMMVMMMNLVETVCWHSPYPRWVWPLQVHPVKHFQTKKSNSETTIMGNQGKKTSLIFQCKEIELCIAVTSVLAISQDDEDAAHHCPEEVCPPGPRYDDEGEDDDDDESLTIVLRRSITLALSQAAVGAVPESLLKVPH